MLERYESIYANGGEEVILRSESRQTIPLLLYNCGWEPCAGGHVYGPAVRTHYLLHYIVKGQGVYQRGKKKWKLSAGEGFLILPGESTIYQADSEDPWEYLWIGFGGYEARQILGDCGMSENRVIFKTDEGERLEEAVRKLVSLFRKTVGRYEILSEMYRIFSILESPDRAPATGADYVSTVKDYIHDNYSYPVRISEISSRIGIDRSYLFKLFKQECGMSPKEYLIAYRLKKACEMLAETPLTAAEAAYSSGFTDVPAFYRIFKSTFGKTPLEYRKDVLKSADKEQDHR